MVSFLTRLNEQMQLPESLQSIEQWMRQTEDQAAAATEILLSGKNVGVLMVNLFADWGFCGSGRRVFLSGRASAILRRNSEKQTCSYMDYRIYFQCDAPSILRFLAPIGLRRFAGIFVFIWP